mmetsp:Transcript_81310/g.161402  ORF Transcript_81310/g.161402 Transcript_81310/m.161402 type:complete len:205 (-) Transcript_81310:169-783(-)
MSSGSMPAGLVGGKSLYNDLAALLGPSSGCNDGCDHSQLANAVLVGISTKTKICWTIASCSFIQQSPQRHTSQPRVLRWWCSPGQPSERARMVLRIRMRRTLGLHSQSGSHTSRSRLRRCTSHSVATSSTVLPPTWKSTVVSALRSCSTSGCGTGLIACHVATLTSAIVHVFALNQGLACGQEHACRCTCDGAKPNRCHKTSCT